MSEDNNLQKLESNLISQLTYIKEEFKKYEVEKAMSIRRDVVVIELKDILQNNADFYSLKDALEVYIEKLKPFK